ncbi:hypothetical protein [Bradyrhizobium sp. AUGA SZCCT0182]|uniref:hypothetical protein n=1 Tax=Bradyrhizobium sp. AUGA SZCCT0182 TaxID=2807667 RepID=UPI001BA8CD58|nr:hypothetical protein [Bradyrhizobium sp. AUGA SZCCT0182]MBR1238418.1 hypothetical protein [Bradyrhizobium sp. AUGA SZCCT0182]
MSDIEDFLMRSGQNVINHCERLLSSCRSDEERERLRRLIGNGEQFLEWLARRGISRRLAV